MQRVRSRRDQRERTAPFPGRVLPRELWTRTRAALGTRGTPFDWLAVFGREAPRVLDLGCGNGRFLLASALERPHMDHLGVELVPPAVRLGTLRMGQRGLTNCKIAWGDATEFVCERCPPSSVDEIHLYHPQPYFDPRQRARRQLTPAVLLAIHRALRPGGRMIVRDHQVDSPKMNRMVALAHDVFNLGLGTGWAVNQAEIRRFTSLEQLTGQLDKVGFRRDPRALYQPGDPTRNALMVFTKA